MSKYTIEQSDKTGKKVYESEVSENVDIFNVNDVISLIDVKDKNEYIVVIKDDSFNPKVIYRLNTKVQYLIEYIDKAKEIESHNDILTFRDEYQINEIYDCLAKIKNWALSDELPTVRNGDNQIISKIKRYVDGHGIKEIKYSLLGSSAEPMPLYP